MFHKITCIIGFIIITGNFGAEQPAPTKTVEKSTILANIENQWKASSLAGGKNLIHEDLFGKAKNDACHYWHQKRLSHELDAPLALGLKKAERIVKAGITPDQYIDGLAGKLKLLHRRLYVLEEMKKHPEIKDSSWPHQPKPHYQPFTGDKLTTSERYLNEFFKKLNETPKGKELEALFEKTPIREEIEFLQNNLAYLLIQKFEN